MQFDLPQRASLGCGLDSGVAPYKWCREIEPLPHAPHEVRGTRLPQPFAMLDLARASDGGEMTTAPSIHPQQVNRPARGRQPCATIPGLGLRTSVRFFLIHNKPLRN